MLLVLFQDVQTTAWLVKSERNSAITASVHRDSVSVPAMVNASVSLDDELIPAVKIILFSV